MMRRFAVNLYIICVLSIIFVSFSYVSYKFWTEYQVNVKMLPQLDMEMNSYLGSYYHESLGFDKNGLVELLKAYPNVKALLFFRQDQPLLEVGGSGYRLNTKGQINSHWWQKAQKIPLNAPSGLTDTDVWVVADVIAVSLIQKLFLLQVLILLCLLTLTLIIWHFDQKLRKGEVILSGQNSSQSSAESIKVDTGKDRYDAVMPLIISEDDSILHLSTDTESSAEALPDLSPGVMDDFGLISPDHLFNDEDSQTQKAIEHDVLDRLGDVFNLNDPGHYLDQILGDATKIAHVQTFLDNASRQSKDLALMVMLVDGSACSLEIVASQLSQWLDMHEKTLVYFDNYFCGIFFEDKDLTDCHTLAKEIYSLVCSQKGVFMGITTNNQRTVDAEHLLCEALEASVVAKDMNVPIIKFSPN